MNSRSLRGCSFTSARVEPTQILSNWLEAITAFHANYNELAERVEASLLKQRAQPGATIYIGQCPARQLETLLKLMCKELEKLLLDMDQFTPGDQPANRKHYRKLALHTIRLEKLNQQAQTRLTLAAQLTS